MSNKALVVIDIQNDITKHYRDIIDTINAAIDWAMDLGMTVIPTSLGEDLSWDYLCYVREHPASWTVPTRSCMAVVIT